ncbi:MAG: hypothetical protein AB7N71_02475 [Phycisphaerae bacterium]
MSKTLPLLFDELDPHAMGTAGPTSGDGWARGVRAIVLIFLATRLVAWTGSYFGAYMAVRVRHNLEPEFQHRQVERLAAFDAANSPERRDVEQHLLNFAPLCMWDGQHYKSIVDGGYDYKTPPTENATRKQLEQNIAFFPLYPMLVKPVAAVTRNTNFSLIFISNLAALTAAIVLFLWARWRVDQRVALFTVAVALCLPQACYYSFAYAESLTLLTTVSTFFLLERRRYWWAAIFCALATATRPTAASLAAVVGLYIWWNSTAETKSRRALKALPYMVVGALGLAAYALFLWAAYGDPRVYLANFRAGWVPDSARASWFEYLTLARVWDQFKYFGRAFAAPPVSFIWLLNPFAWNMVTNFAILFLSLAGIARVPRSFRPLLWLGPLIFVQAYLASGGATFGVEPISRYMAVSVGAFVVLAAWMVREWREGWRIALIAAMLVLQFAWAFRFSFGEWSS